VSERPKVTIVTPSYNQGRYLEETILSVLEQDYPNLEYIVVDDGSTDESPEIIRRHEDRLAWWTRQENAGQVAAINRGFARSSGEIMGYLNSDDTLLPGAIATLVDELERDPSLVLVYGDSLYTDEESTNVGYLPSREWNIPAMVRRCDNHVVQPSALWRRSGWDAVGPMNERGYYFFDFEFFIRLSALGPAKHIATPVSTYRLHAESKTIGAPLRKARDHVRFADEFLASDEVPEALRPFVREGRATAHRYAGLYFHEALETREARRAYLRSFRLHPRSLLSPRALALFARTLVPRAAIRRLRALRRRSSPAPSPPS